MCTDPQALHFKKSRAMVASLQEKKKIVAYSLKCQVKIGENEQWA